MSNVSHDDAAIASNSYTLVELGLPGIILEWMFLPLLICTFLVVPWVTTQTLVGLDAIGVSGLSAHWNELNFAGWCIAWSTAGWLGLINNSVLYTLGVPIVLLEGLVQPSMPLYWKGILENGPLFIVMVVIFALLCGMCMATVLEWARLHFVKISVVVVDKT